MPYFTHGETKYKLILLYIAQQAQRLLTRDQLYRTAILNSKMDFFAFEEALKGLEEDGMLTAVRRPFGDCWGLTDTGREALSMFENSIPADERRKLDQYLSDNREQFSRETEITSRIEKNPDGQCELVLLINERDKAIFTVRLRVASEEQALILRSRWEESSESIYNYVWDSLMNRQER